MRLRLHLLPAIAVLVTVAPLAAQDAPESRRSTPSEWYAGASYGVQSFFDGPSPWHLATASVGHKSGFGSVIGRANFAHRFGKDGEQVELDAYPRLAEGVYAYLNIGYSGSSIFPEWRSGAEIFASLPNAYEASLGYRQLRFGTPVTLFTGSVGKYAGNYWYSLRPYLRSKTGGTSASLSLLARRYYEDSDHFIGARIGFGSTPSDQLVPDQAVQRSNSFTSGVQGSTSLTKSVLGTWSAGYEYEELSASSTRKSVTVDLGIRVLF